MYQPIYETAYRPAFTPAALQPLTREMQSMNFQPETLTPEKATFRDGDRYVMLALEEGLLTARLGVGSQAEGQASLSSMRLDEMIAFLYGGLKRGCHAADEVALDACLCGVMKDLKEFANEFLRGDFRPFLRVLAMKKREDREAAKAKEDLAKKIYLA